MSLLTADAFFDLDTFSHRALFFETLYVWDALKNLKTYMDGADYPRLPKWMAKAVPLTTTMVAWDGNWIPGNDCEIEFGDATKGGLVVRRAGKVLDGASVLMGGTVIVGDRFQIGKGVLVEAGAFLQGPVILGDNSVVRQGAYLRGYCLAGQRCVLGHVTEVKHSVFLDDAKAGHFAYLGDSILGSNVNLGAGTKLANLRFVRGDVRIKTREGQLSTGLRKMGAILGDNVQTGCNSVTNPGTLLGPSSMVLPCVMVPSGFHAGHSIIR